MVEALVIYYFSNYHYQYSFYFLLLCIHQPILNIMLDYFPESFGLSAFTSKLHELHRIQEACRRDYVYPYPHMP